MILSLLRHCNSLRQLHSIHARATVNGVVSPFIFSKLLFTLTTLLAYHHHHLCSSSTNLHYAFSLFHSIPNPTTFLFNLLIRIHLLLSFPSVALLLFAAMRRAAVPPDPHTFPFALKASALLSDLRLARALHAQSSKFGFAAADLFVRNSLIAAYSLSPTEAQRLFDETPLRDIVTYNTLIDVFLKAGYLHVARNLFDEMPNRDVFSWGTLLAGYSQVGDHEETLKLFKRMMVSSSIDPDDVAIVAVLSSCAGLGKLGLGKKIHDYVRKSRRRVSIYLSTALVDMYVKCGCLNTAMKIFESSERKNLLTWNAIIIGLSMHGHGQLSLRYFDRMIASGAGVRPDGITFLGVLVGCSHSGMVDAARHLFEEMWRVYGVRKELKHYGCMADLLGRAGFIDEALEMIAGMPMEGDAYVWGGVLGGCRIHGNVEAAEIAARKLLELNPDDSGIHAIMAEIYAGSGRMEDSRRRRMKLMERNVRKNIASSSLLQFEEDK